MNTSINGQYDTKRKATMSQTKEEKNRKARDSRAAKKAVPDQAKANSKRPTLTLPTKLPVDLDMPAFLDRTNPENEAKAATAREKRAEELRNRPVPTPAAKPLNAALSKSKSSAGNKPAKAPSTYQIVSELVVKQPNIAIEALMKAVKANGLPDAKQVTVATFRAGARNTMLLIQKLRNIDLGVV